MKIGDGSRTAGGPKRGPPANAIPVPGSEGPRTPFDPGTTGEGLRCAQRQKSFMPKGLRDQAKALRLVFCLWKDDLTLYT